MPTSDSDVFEVAGPARPARRPCLQDVVYVEVSDDDVVAVPTAEVRRQVFYYSAKMYQYLCENGTPERIAQAAMRKVDDRQGVLKKRKESQCRTEKLREYAKEHNVVKPAGSELARLRRNRAATAKNTALVMGRNADQIKRRKYNQEQSDFSQSSQQEQRVLASQDQQPCSQNECRKRVRQLYVSTVIPFFTSEQEAAEEPHCVDTKRALAKFCNQLAFDFPFDEADCVPIEEKMCWPQTNYEVHGHFLSAVICMCTQKKTGEVFVRASVSAKKQYCTLKCKLSKELTGRRTQRKQPKESDYKAQAALMKADVDAKSNALWAGEHRTSFTKRIASCRCSLRLRYMSHANEWRATKLCSSHSGHDNVEKVPSPQQLPTMFIDVLQKLRSNISANVQQQAQFCEQNGLPVSHDFLRRINSSSAADPTFGLSGDAGFLMSLIGSEKTSFVAEFEVSDSTKVVVQRVTVARVDGQYLHVQGGRHSDKPCNSYEGLDSRTSDGQLKTFYDFLLPYLSRAPSLRATVRNCCWRTCEDAEYLSAHPNVIMFDTTCKTNIKNKHFGYGSGLTTNRNWFKGWSFILESLQKRDFSWLWNTALPVIIPASVRARLLVVVTDGDQNMIDAISSAFTLGRNGQFLWGTQDKPVLLRRCIFHLLHLNFEKEYANFKTDGGVGIKVRDWLKQAARRALTKAQLLSAIDKILEWVQTVTNDLFTDAARECLLEWVRARSRHTQDWARYPFNSCRSFDYETTSPAEGAHSGLKMSNEVRFFFCVVDINLIWCLCRFMATLNWRTCFWLIADASVNCISTIEERLLQNLWKRQQM